jgi:hypothetical protein
MAIGKEACNISDAINVSSNAFAAITWDIEFASNELSRLVNDEPSFYLGTLDIPMVFRTNLDLELSWSEGLERITDEKGLCLLQKK